MIRAAVATDATQIIEMGMRFIAETAVRDWLGINPTQMRAFVLGLIADQDGVIFVSGTDDVLTGMIGVKVYVHPMSGERFASEMFWWTQPEARGQGIRLLRKAEQWAAALGARSLQMISPNPRVGQMYAALGYEKTEELWMRPLGEAHAVRSVA